jgi:transcriptional regulator with PAS, ATPase and Fis domain
MPVGSTTEERSDFRLIAATHKSLEDSVSQGFFRQDLYFRINAVTFKLLPLRDRLEDLLDLVQFFVQESAKEHSKRIRGVDEAASGLLLDFDWPGNIRQLQNAIQRAIVLVPEGQEVLMAADFRFLTEKEAPAELPKLSDAKEQFIKNYVKKAILIHRGNKTKAAKALGVDPKTLYRHLSEDKD